MSQIFAYCPSCKQPATPFNQNKHYCCPHCQFEYFHNVAAAAAAIIEVDNEILFTERKRAPQQGRLDLPGGFIDMGESAEQGLSRELKEELALSIRPEMWQYLGSYPNQYPHGDVLYHTCDQVFVLSLSAKPEFKLQASEISSVCWLAKSSIPFEQIGFDSLRQAVKDYCQSAV